jgi:hypothetical protein
MSELDPRVLETVDHVQKAALELIAALRTALDVAEDFARDPSAVQTLIGQASDFWRASAAGGGWTGQKSEESDARVERIDVE